MATGLGDAGAPVFLAYEGTAPRPPLQAAAKAAVLETSTVARSIHRIGAARARGRLDVTT